MQIDALIVLAVAGICSAVAVPIAAGYARKRKLLDIPNERSSHNVPTPRTGGVGIVLGALIGTAVTLLLSGRLFETYTLVILGVLTLGAAIGFLDDLFGLSTKLRMGLYLVCALAASYFGAGVTEVVLPGFPPIWIGWIGGVVFSTLFITWYANLFNFMDGIDGIAGSAATVTLSALAVVFYGHEPIWMAICIASAAASVGFLLHNFPPAKVFMGDGGAVFLGLQCGACSLIAVNKGLISLPAVVLLMFPFVFDATFTLLRRIFRRERFWAAHRTHLYQQMCDLGFSHRKVTSIYTVAAMICAFAGLYFSQMPVWVQISIWYGMTTFATVFSLGIVRKNFHDS